ncbi:hypothetical protein L0337_42440 [candidate division KSB1 bacterium]|nr:hypothetical protein [candidate division KSB1 bacterium]
MLKGVHLTLLMGPVVPVPVPRGVIEALNSVQVTTSAGQRSGFQLSFALSKRSLLMTTLLPAGFFDPKRRVIIVATVNGFPNVLMDGVITRQEVSVSNEIGQTVLNVTGEDLTVLMDLKENKGVPFPGMPESTRVIALLGKYAVFGIIPLVIPELFPNIVSPIQRIEFQEGTDLNYIQKLAEKNGYVFYIDPGPLPGVNKAYWGPEIRIGLPQPALNVNMDAHTNVDSLSFSFDGLSTTKYGVTIQIPFTKIGIDVPIPEINLLKPPLAVKQAPALKFETLKETAKFDFAKAVSLGLGKASESADAVSGNGQLDVLRYGRVLKARQLVGVRGAGTSYDGLYFVKSVTHNIKPGEYKQSFNVTRNGTISITPRVIP